MKKNWLKEFDEPAQEAIRVMKKLGLKKDIHAAMKASRDRAREITKELENG